MLKNHTLDVFDLLKKKDVTYIDIKKRKINVSFTFIFISIRTSIKFRSIQITDKKTNATFVYATKYYFSCLI